ncbi:hypothetical protein ACQRIU_007021 [Beauveria bassiana]
MSIGFLLPTCTENALSMLALADLLNPPPSQKGRAPEAVMVEADAPANPDPNTANEQILSNDAKSAKHSAQTKRSASLIGSAVSFASLYKVLLLRPRPPYFLASPSFSHIPVYLYCSLVSFT